MLTVTLHLSAGSFTLDLAFEAPTPGVIALFGPSGAGKSLTLAAIAGLLRAERAEIVLDGIRLDALPAERRRIGVVFQDARLFPHLSVAGNLRYAARRAPPGPFAWDRVVTLLDLGPLLARRPATLSGGERQRVAIGRALLAQPRLLLMDEPMSALDAPRRDELLPFLARLRGLDLPILYVSHALDEVLRLADTLVLIEHGRVIASGPVEALTARPDLPLAHRDDAAGLLRGTVRAQLAGGLTELRCGEDVLLVPALDLLPGTPVRVRIHAREVVLALDRPGRISVQNVLAGRIVARSDEPPRRAVLLAVACAGGTLLARVTEEAASRLGLQSGGEVFALVKSMSVEAAAE